MEWIEVEAVTVDEAISEALKELGLSSDEEAKIEVLREGKTGFIGIGRQMAVVKVSKAPPQKRRRGRRRGRGRDEADESKRASTGRDQREGKARSTGSTKKSSNRNQGGAKNRPDRGKRRPEMNDSEKQQRTDDGRQYSDGEGGSTHSNDASNLSEQTEVAADFLRGLLDAFGLEGTVETRTEKDILYIDIEGDQTEALVGPRGTVLQAVHELTRTVVQRKTYRAPRIRLDIAGYAARRREALQIYSKQLAEKVIAEHEEIMLEPMAAVDRKVVHDAIGDIDGVRSFSEGQEPHRSVVVAPAE